MAAGWYVVGPVVLVIGCSGDTHSRHVVPPEDAGLDARCLASGGEGSGVVEAGEPALGNGGRAGRSDAAVGGQTGARDASLDAPRVLVVPADGGSVVPDHCGDGVLDPNEECDDGNRNNYDNCTATCRNSALSAGRDHTCALVSDTVRCWGRGEHGQLGDGTFYLTAPRGVAVPVTANASFHAVRLSLGQDHTCALVDDGTVRCWGLGQYGQLGDDTLHTDATGGSAVPVAASLTKVLQLEAGGDNGCALLEDATARCWGFGIFGQLGDGAKQTSATPVAVSGLPGIAQLTAGDQVACGLLSDRTVSCWGYAGDDAAAGTAIYNGAPIAVAGLAAVVEVAAGPDFACALLEGGKVSCWGEGNAGQLGNGARLDSKVPVQVENIDGAIAITAGRLHSCALLRSGAVRCWGDGALGQLGDGTRHDGFPTSVVAPVAVALPRVAVEIVAGGRHTCAVLADHSVQCWGDGTYGQLGNGAFKSTLAPVPVAL